MTLAVRPSAAQIDRAFTSGLAMPPVVPLAKEQVGGDGAFALRADLPADLAPEYRADGWVNVLLVATDGTDIRLATDSMYYDPAPLTTKSRWLTSPSARQQRETYAIQSLFLPQADMAAQQAGLVANLESDLDSPRERPSTIVFGAGPPATGGAGPVQAAAAPPSPYVGCFVTYVAARSAGFQTIADIFQSPQWQTLIRYKQTNTSSFEAGFSASGSGGWSVAGSASFSNSSAYGFETAWPVTPVNDATVTTFQIELNFDKIQLRCAKDTNPGPYYVYTSEPTAWLGGTRNVGGSLWGCSQTPWYLRSVGGGTYLYKQGSGATTWSASGGVFNFFGKATVGYSAEVQLGWRNNLNYTRNLCGESGSPLTRNTRVFPK